MPVLQKRAARLRTWFSSTDDVTFSVRASARTARFVIPVIEKLTREDLIGQTYRLAVALWGRWEQPPLTLYEGDVSLCRIHGPLLKGSAGYRPSGGLIETPGLHTSLTSAEAHELDQRLQKAIERVIREWAEERDCEADAHKLMLDGNDHEVPTAADPSSEHFPNSKTTAPIQRPESPRISNTRGKEGENA